MSAQGPSPNVTNRALSLSTNLGKPGNGTGIMSNNGGKGGNKQQSIQNIYSEKNHPQIGGISSKSGGAVSALAGAVKGGSQLSQSIDLYKQ